MEVKYEVNQDLFFTITDSDITGVSTTNNNKEIISILELDNIDKLNVIIDGKKLTIDEKWLFAKKVQVVTKLTNINFIKSVEDYMDYIIKKNLIQMKNPDKKKESSLKIVGLSPEYLEMAIQVIEKKFATKSRGIKITGDNDHFYQIQVS